MDLIIYLAKRVFLAGGIGVAALVLVAITSAADASQQVVCVFLSAIVVPFLVHIFLTQPNLSVVSYWLRLATNALYAAGGFVLITVLGIASLGIMLVIVVGVAFFAVTFLQDLRDGVAEQDKGEVKELSLRMA